MSTTSGRNLDSSLAVKLDAAAEANSSKDLNTLVIENRWETRDQIYIGDMPEIALRYNLDDLPIMTQVKDLSIRGIGLIHRSFTKECIGKTVILSLGENKKYNVTGKVNSFDSVPFSGEKQNRIGVVFISEQTHFKNRPKRFACPKNFGAVAYGEHPFKYNHNLLYSISDFSANGLTLIGSTQKNILFPGTTVLLTILIPSFGEFQVEVEITNIRPIADSTEDSRPNSNRNFIVGGTFKNPTQNLMVAISSYLLLDPDLGHSISDLKNNGFLVPDMDPIVQFSYVSNESEWSEVLKLRLRAAQAAGRWLGEIDHFKMVDEYDRYARHVICKVHNRIIGAGRIVFNDNNANRVEHAKIAPIPEKLWKEKFVELSRVCTDPQYRGSSIFVGLMQHMGRSAAQNRVRYGLMNCEDSLVPIYAKHGASELGVRFQTKYMQHTYLNLMVFDFHNYFRAKDISAAAWYILWRDVHKYLIENKFIKTTLLDKLRIGFKTLLGFIIIKTYRLISFDKALKKRRQVLNSFVNPDTERRGS